MNTTNKVEISRDFRISSNAIKFDFHGKFTDQTCHQAVNDFYNLYQNADYTFIWDCSKMTGFDFSARKEWIEFMNELQGKIDRILIISDNIVIRGSARLILKLLGQDGEVYKRYSDILTDIKQLQLEVA